jgi:hypothetical protein
MPGGEVDYRCPEGVSQEALKRGEESPGSKGQGAG